MSILSYIFPQTIARFSTKYNRDIRVVEEQGKYKLLVSGSRQSGEYIRMLWQRVISDFGVIPSPDVRSILVLGVAGGTVIHLLHAIYPEARIEGVDIDEKMIEVGEKYFSLSKVNGLTLIQGDAATFIKRSKNHWDLVVIDLFIGANIPPFVGDEVFLLNIKKILTPRGTVLINYLREFEYEKLSDLLYTRLTKVFSEVKDTKIFFNRFFRCM